MKPYRAVLFGAAATAALLAMQPGMAFAQAAGGSPTSVTEVIVTAQKRQENIQNVGMSIQAASGAQLAKLNVRSAADLTKLVPSFTVTPTYYGTQVFQIRGVGFQDTSLGGSPTVTVYQDEVPLPFTAVTSGAALDVQRVEVLKGPQGTLYGENATGGAINFVTNKPTDTFQAGVDATYGRFNDVNLQGYVSGPILPDLDARLALRTEQSGAWQKSYGGAGSLQPASEIGGKDFNDARLTLEWKPTDRFTAMLSSNLWVDRGFSQMGQLYGIDLLSKNAPGATAILDYPLAPHNDQAAGWNRCVNDSPFDPIQGGADAVYSGGQPLACTAPRRNDNYYNTNLRMDYRLTDDITLTSLTSYQDYHRRDAIDGSGMAIQDYQSMQYGKISTIYQELRLSGKFEGKGDWIVGGNYEYDETWDRFLQTYAASTANPTYIWGGIVCGEQNLLGQTISCSPAAANVGKATGGYVVPPLGPTQPEDEQKTSTYAVFANAEYPIIDNLTLQAGLRFTQENKAYSMGCGADGGDGTWSTVSQTIQDYEQLEHGLITGDEYLTDQTGHVAPLDGYTYSWNGYTGGYGVNNGPHGCGTFTSYAPYVALAPNGFSSQLNQNNISWRTGLNWKATPTTLLYFNVSQGWKGGSYPTVAMAQTDQDHPVVQEGLLAYEGGFKGSWFDHQLTVDGAGFYYNYTNKQILGAIADVVYGTLPALVNVPQSHVIGAELSATYVPEWLRGLTVTGAVTYDFTQIDKSSKNVCSQALLNANYDSALRTTCVPGDYYGYESVEGNYVDLTNQPFPDAPQWSFTGDAEYDWKVWNEATAFIGGDVNYQSTSINFWSGPLPNPYGIPARTILDLRAGVEKGPWRFQLWGNNVTNVWYWTSAVHVNDVLLRYTGQPVSYGATFSYKFN